jgi:hypothetical protein
MIFCIILALWPMENNCFSIQKILKAHKGFASDFRRENDRYSMVLIN